jgi:EmrB/QacA subfamily drug resistance transporter
MRTNRIGLIAICVATFMLLLDIMIVQVALPSVRRDLGGDLSGLQWTVDAYALALSSLVLPFGVLADRFGRRRIFIAGLIGFSVASAACAAAPTLTALDVFRALQGIAGAAMFATVLALIGQEFPGAARGRAIAAWGATTGAAVASGPIAGGLLTEYVNWRAIFLVNVPIGVAGVVLGMRSLGPGRDGSARRLDVLGSATLAFGLFSLVGGLLRGSAANWQGAFGPAAVTVGVVALAVFAALQRRKTAMVDLALFRRPQFVGVSLSLLAMASGMFAATLYITLYLQQTRGYSPVVCGLLFMPFSIFAFAVPMLAPRFGVPVMSGRTISIGLALIAAGLALMTMTTADHLTAAFFAGLVSAGVGVGLANPSVGALGLAVVPPTRAGLAAGLSNTFRLAGVALGVAVLGVAYRSGTHTSLEHFHAVLVVGVVITLAGAVAGGVLVGHRPLARTAAAAPPTYAAETA